MFVWTVVATTTEMEQQGVYAVIYSRRFARYGLATLLLCSLCSCTLTPQSCDPTLPDIGVSKALGCWLTGNTEKNIENVRSELQAMYSQIELQDIAVRQIEVSSARLAKDIDAFRAYTRQTQLDLASLEARLANATLETDRQRVTRDALALETSSLRQQLALATNAGLPSADAIAELQRDVSRKKSALEAITDGILVE